jgi:flavin prenyltransferase
MNPMIVAITGASGSIYGLRLVQALVELNHQVLLVISNHARTVFEKEMDVSLPTSNTAILETLFEKKISDRVTLLSYRDIAASIASGSFQTQGMIICPCSMSTLGEIAGGLSSNLISRAADVTIKEGRKLVLLPREMPFSAVHLENMLKLAKIGVCIMPAAPGFYHKPKNLNDLVNFVVGRILDQLGINHRLYHRWSGHETSMEELPVINNR